MDKIKCWSSSCQPRLSREQQGSRGEQKVRRAQVRIVQVEKI